MTEIRIWKTHDSVTKVECKGHTGYADAGEDIVCAGISSIVQTALLGLLAVAKINVAFHRDEKNGVLTFSLDENLSGEKRHDADVILNTMICGLSDFYTEYSDYMNLEVI